ncbi:MAG TPA: hypothetical protein ENH26_02425 [Candidatus Wolfebacteria bacterium]|nr:hypothetical protein [Candidatus Wolfebacteria bacterium]
MNCTEIECKGRINPDINASLPCSCEPDCTQKEIAYPCNVCGKLHWGSGKPAYGKNKPHQKVYLQKDGKTIYKLV